MKLYVAQKNDKFVVAYDLHKNREMNENLIIKWFLSVYYYNIWKANQVMDDFK